MARSRADDGVFRQSLVLLTFVVSSPLLCASASAHERFLSKYCYTCHGPDKQKSDRRFDTLPDTISSASDFERIQEIVDQLNLSEMPPEGEPQPSVTERASVIEALTKKIAKAQTEFVGTGGHSVLRRLNAWEYRQTLGDLLSLNVEAWNPAAHFPAEVKVKGFDNNGAELVTSGMLLEHYFAAAEEAIRRATHFEGRPPLRTYTQASPFYFKKSPIPEVELPKLFQLDRFRYTPDVPYTDLFGRHYRGGHIGFLPLLGGVTQSGTYTIRVRAAAVDRTHSYGKPLADFPNGDPLVLELVAVDRAGSVKSAGNVAAQRRLATVELTHEAPQWFEWKVVLDEGYEPELRFRNGTQKAKRLIRLLMNVADDHDELRPFKEMKPGAEKAHGVLKAYRGPKLRIYEIQVAGPHLDRWPPQGHQLLYGDQPPEDLDRESMVERLRVFAAAAYHRPLQENELTPIESLVAEKLTAGVAPLAALQLGFQTILCSPGFLYRQEGEGPLDDYALAARLSYFLWSSQPDSQLLGRAALKKLRDTTSLGEEVDRMLADPKSQRFVRHFLHSWLDLDTIGVMPPSADFVAYYRDSLESAMRAETEAFFRHVLDRNLPPREFLSADYTFVNRELALHYGLPDVQGNAFRQVSLQGTTRGGLLGHGSFLTASANGVDTSPVLRGIYVLEKLLGYTPPPPPDDVPEIEPDIRGATTVREQLAKHREIATCAECHRKIDPLGFALENFDAIGGWRSQYGKNRPIDASGQLPDGQRFTGIRDFRKLMTERHEQFSRSLTEKLLTYAIGRELEIGDRSSVDAILRELHQDRQGLHDLIRLVVLSDTFRRN